MASRLEQWFPTLAFVRDPLGFLIRARDEGPIIRTRIAGGRVWIVNESDLIHEVLVTKYSSFHKGRALQYAREGIVGDGLLTSEGETHRRHRRIMQPAFHAKQIANYADIMARTAAAIRSRWEDGEVVDVHSEMMRLTLDVICETMFGSQIEADRTAIEEGLTASLRFLVRRARSLWPLWLLRRSDIAKLADTGAARLESILRQLIEDRRANLDGEKGDLLSLLLCARDEEDGSGLTDKELLDEVATIFIAGHETTANALSWTFYLLAQAPEVLQSLREEVDRVLCGRLPRFADYAQLSYTQAVLAESMRLYPPAWILVRQVVQPVQIGDVRMKPGEAVMLSPYAMHHHPDYFPDPMAFKPERWQNDFARTLPRYAYFPFGGGPRICIGNHFALLEGALVLAELVQHVSFHLVDPPEHIRPEPLITLRVHGPLRMKVQHRSGSV